MKSIKTKLIISISILIIVSSASLGFYSIQSSSSSLKQEAEKSLEALATESARLTESRVETQLMALKMIALREDIRDMNWKVQQPILQNQVKSTGFLDIAVVLSDGTANYSAGNTNQLGDREYVKKAFSGEANVSDLILSRVTNEVVLMYAVPIENKGKVVGVLIGRADGNALSELAKDTGYGSEGYGFMINSKGTIVAHPNKDFVMNQFNPIDEVKNDDSTHKSLATMIEKILVDNKGVGEYTFEGRDMYSGYTPIEGSDWIFIIAANKKEVLSAIPGLRLGTVIVTAVICLISVVLAYVLGSSLTKPIIHTVKLSKNMAELDMTQDMPKDLLNRKDEMGDLSKAIQVIINSLREIIIEISDSSEQVAAASQQLTASTQQSASSAEEISRTVLEIAKGASEQAQNTEDGTNRAALLGDTIEEELDYVKNLNNASAKVTAAVKEGLEVIDNLTNISEINNNAIKEIHDVIIKTNESANKIGEASIVIASIAKQTNLLALNASIEASRAGNSGGGFTVIAQEVRQLAEQSGVSISFIDKMVKELQENSQTAVKTVESVTAISKDQMASTLNSRDKYLQIAQATKDSEKAIEQLNASGERMEQVKNDILDVLQNLSAIAEENSASTEEVTATMEEQSATIDEIAGASELMSGQAQNLQQLIMKFKI